MVGLGQERVSYRWIELFHSVNQQIFDSLVKSTFGKPNISMKGNYVSFIYEIPLFVSLLNEITKFDSITREHKFVSTIFMD